KTSEVDYDNAMGMLDKQTQLEVKSKIDNLLMGKIDIYINEQKVYKKDGSYLWALLKGKLIRDIFTNVPIKISGTVTDITNQKKREFHLQKTLDIVSEQNKRLLNFAHIVSHNLRNHASNFEMLVNLFELSETQEEKNYILKMLKESSFNLTDTITNLNEVVSIQTQLNQKKSNLNLVEYINKTFNSLASEIELYGVEIKNNIIKETSIQFNAAYFESILLNIISNAIKYRSSKRQCTISLNSYYQEKYIILEVSDNGKGIDLDRYGKKIFGMYKTFHNNPDARGIGLFITKNQIEALGGKIEVNSNLDEGTTFKLFFLNDQDN
ncbi:MAG: sensor histidine kinase, partial [Candidatus Sericytochromatia bacterium]